MSASKSVVLITGANTGIGYLTADCLAKSSFNYHIIVTSRSIPNGEAALTTLRESNPTASFSLLQLDVTDEKSITKAFDSVTKEFGVLDVLINNAGIISHEPSLLSNLRITFETNTFGPAFITQTFTPLLLRSSNPRLIYVSSSQGSIKERGDPNGGHHWVKGNVYRMSKAALNMLMMCDHVDFEGKVKVWAFNPGFVVTDLSRMGERGLELRRQHGAGDPRKSAEGIVALVEGKRDDEVGCFVGLEGVHEW